MVDIGNIGGSVPVVRAPVPVKQEVALPSLKKAAAPVQIEIPVEVQTQAIERPKVTFADVQQASQVVASNPYPISDQRFTIFRDIAGDYVTRFTSLVDGSVEYFPQKSLFELVQVLKGKIVASTIDTQA
jgi:hypothetical protein